MKIHIWTYLSDKGDRIPWRVSNLPFKDEKLKSTDEVSSGWFFTDEELETLKEQWRTRGEVDARFEEVENRTIEELKKNG